MEEDEFRQTYDAMRPLPCVFEKAILNRHCGCALVERLNVAEREGVRCTQWTAARNCRILLGLLREKGRFALHLASIPGPLPHAQELRLQVGGLQGIQLALQPGEPEKVEDIHGLLARARATFGGLDGLPFDQVIQGITAFRGRRRRSPRPRD